MTTPISDAIAVHAQRMAELRQAVAERWVSEGKPLGVGMQAGGALGVEPVTRWLPEEQAGYEEHRRAIYAIRAEATAAAIGNPPVEWTADGLTIRVESVETAEVGGDPERVERSLELSPAGVGMELESDPVTLEPVTPRSAAVRCIIAVERQGKPVEAGDGVFIFINPPVLVPDDAGEIVREVRDHDGALIDTLRYREDPDAALRQAITDTVAAAVRAALGR